MDEYLEKFGIRKWRGFDSDEVFPCRTVRKVSALVDEAARRQGWVAIRGEVGAGKTTAVDDALRKSGAVIVRPETLETGRVTISHVLEAILRELSSETVRQSLEARCHQVRRVLGEAARRKRIVLVLEDAHYLHRQTLSALKRLREMEWAGRKKLIGVVMVGGAELGAKLRQLPEAGLRARSLNVEGMTKQEIVNYINWLGLAKAFDSEAAAILAGSCSRPLEVQAAIRDAVERAYYQGSPKVKVEHVVGDNIRRRVVQEGYGKVARRAGVSKSTVHGFAQGREVTAETEEKIRAAISA